MTLELPPAGTYGAEMRGMSLFRHLNGLMVWMARRSGGEGGRAGLVLTTVGARTGEERSVALAKFPDGEGRWLVIAALAGAAHHPAWLINLAKHPDKVWVEYGHQRFKVRPEILRGAERAEAWQRVVAVAEGFATYQKKTDREIPVVRLTLES